MHRFSNKNKHNLHIDKNHTKLQRVFKGEISPMVVSNNAPRAGQQQHWVIGTRALTTNIGDHPYLAWTTDQNHNGGFYGETLQEWRSLT